MRLLTTATTAMLLVLAGCAGPSQPTTSSASSPRSPSASAPSGATVSTAPAPAPAPSEPADTSNRSVAEPDPLGSDGRPRPASLDIPRIGVSDLRVLPYRGRPDDAAGTDIQDSGLAASPHGPGGGTGAGAIGNYIVTAHRLSSTRAFLRLPELSAGDRVHVVAGARRYVYEVTRTRWTSFRSEGSLTAQSSPVPGRPGKEATRAMITLSTCATPEDHAAGNYWSDEFGNPEHRIDKIGVLVAVRSA